MNLELGPMRESPGQCTLCGCVPVDETQEMKPPLPAVHAVGLDVNWGDSVYICWTCSGVIADLVDRPASETVRRIVKRARELKAENRELKGRNAELEAIFAKLQAGREGTKAAREAVSS